MNYLLQNPQWVCPACLYTQLQKTLNIKTSLKSLRLDRDRGTGTQGSQGWVSGFPGSHSGESHVDPSRTPPPPTPHLLPAEAVDSGPGPASCPGRARGPRLRPPLQLPAPPRASGRCARRHGNGYGGAQGAKHAGRDRSYARFRPTSAPGSDPLTAGETLSATLPSIPRGDIPYRWRWRCPVSQRWRLVGS